MLYKATEGNTQIRKNINKFDHDQVFFIHLLNQTFGSSSTPSLSIRQISPHISIFEISWKPWRMAVLRGRDISFKSVLVFKRGKVIFMQNKKNQIWTNMEFSSGMFIFWALLICTFCWWPTNFGNVKWCLKMKHVILGESTF